MANVLIKANPKKGEHLENKEKEYYFWHQLN